MSQVIQDVAVPDSQLAREITEFVRDTSTRCSFIIRAASICSAPWKACVAA